MGKGWGNASRSFKKGLVVGVETNPEPVNAIPLPKAQSSISQAYAHRVNGLRWAYPFKLQAGMMRLPVPKDKSASLPAYIRWQLSKAL
jgi:hypothetical protein